MTDHPRIPPLPEEERSPDQQRLVEATGSELNVFTTLVRHPKLFEDFSRFGGRLLRRSGLPDRTREILILRTAYRCRATYEWVQHVEIGRGVGVPPEVIALLEVEHPAPADPDLAVLIAAADQLTANRDLDDPTWAALGERFDERQLIEICLLVGSYAMLAGALNSMRVPLEPGQSPPDWA